MMKNRKVIAAGHICLDMTPLFPPEGGRGDIGSMLIPGKLLRMQGCDVHTGGSVANTGLAMKKMGLDVKLMGKAGTDAFGDMIESILSSYGVSGLIRDDRSPTSYTVVLAIPGNDRIFLHDPGANNTFVSGDIADEELRKASLIHFGYPPLMEKMMEKDGAELKNLFSRAHAAGAATSLDMAAVDPASDAGRLDWTGYLSNVLPETDFFVPSFEEICFMLDRERYDALCRLGGSMTDHIDFDRDVRPLAERILSLGAGCVLIKCGTKGMLLMTAGRKRISRIPDEMCDADKWSDVSVLQPCFRAPQVLSATGAGDTAIAAFLYGILTGASPAKSLQLAAAQGAMCVTAWDAVSGLKTAEELERMFDISEE